MSHPKQANKQIFKDKNALRSGIPRFSLKLSVKALNDPDTSTKAGAEKRKRLASLKNTRQKHLL